ncbi:DUF222 domain-containing protein [Mycobacterium sp. smrl_JER01]|uniref:HNH endonuclease signature motif containing protein n=1 Tax=Mycobacterium sp. smrl_JER01 TaxID=3402633 RepID=UPI003AC28AA2
MFEDWSDASVVGLAEDAHRDVAIAMARALAAVAELLDRRIDEELEREQDVKSMITGFRRATAEVGAALKLSAAQARTLLRQADALNTRLPAVGTLLASGRVDWNTVQLALSRTDLVDDELIGRVDAALAAQLGGWRTWSRKNVIDAIDAEVIALDPDAAKQRRARAYDERSVVVESGLDGMGWLKARMSATQAAAWDKKLASMATATCPADPRTLQQRRSDALDAIRDDRPFGCACTEPDCSARAGAACSGATMVLHVIATAETVAGRSDRPGYLAGYGVVDAELIRELARDATRRLVEEPVISDEQARTYRPSAALDRYIRARDLTCRFPGCTVPATRCDIDHTEPFNHDDPASGGQTVPENLACYCREHHRDKTFDKGWRDRQLGDGAIVWTSPTGKVYRTTPGGTALFGPMHRPRRPDERRRVSRSRRQLDEHRHGSIYNRYRNREAKEEVRIRRWRNESRRFRVLFHGETTDVKPSKSPFCTWINDPIEDEHLPANWQPPPLHRDDPDEPPPF